MSTETATVETLLAEVRTLMVGNRQVTLSVVKQIDRVKYAQLNPMGRVQAGRKDQPTEGESEIGVIGRHRVDGSLVFAYAPDMPQAENWPTSWDHWSAHSVARGNYQAWQPLEISQNISPSVRIIWHTWDLGRISRSHIPCAHLKTEGPFPQYENSGDYHWRNWVAGRAVAPPYSIRPESDQEYSPEKDWLQAEWKWKALRGWFCDLDSLRAEWESEAMTEAVRQREIIHIHREAEALPLIVLAGLK